MEQRMTSTTSRSIRLVAVITVGITVGLGGAFGVAAVNTHDDPGDPRYGRTIEPELIEYAHDHGLSGLSPASLQPTSAYTDIAEIEAYAHAAGLTGLSPASLHPVTTNP
jgi:hypothetical protein